MWISTEWVDYPGCVAPRNEHFGAVDHSVLEMFTTLPTIAVLPSS